MRIVQEALTNIARHARANKVQVQLERKKSAVNVLIEDNGKGFDVDEFTDPAIHTSGMGLLGMQERVTSLHGTLSIQSEPGQGTQLVVTIPLHPEDIE